MSMRWTCDITVRRKIRAPDGIGGWTVDWGDVATSMARVSPLSARDRLQYDQMQYRVTHKVYVPGSTNLRPEDRVVVGQRTLLVKGVTNPSEVGHHLEVLCEEVTLPVS